MEALPPLRLPRCLLEPRLATVDRADAEGLVAVQLHHQEGLIRRIEPVDPRLAAGPLPLALPPLVEPHAHLDKAYSGQHFPNPAGTMAGAMAANRQEAQQRTAAAVEQRAGRALAQAWQHGVRAIRSHIDSLGPWAEPSWEVLEGLAQAWKGRVDLQLVALVPISHWLTPDGEALAQRVAQRGGLLGGVVGAPFPPSRQDRRALKALLHLAQTHGCAIDLHIDECDLQQGRGMALLSHLVRHQPPGVPITCSHASCLGGLPPKHQDRLCRQVAEAQLQVVALPRTNFWLLNQRPGRSPYQRAQAPIQPLQQAGVTVAVGGDNVQDPWFPGGNFDPLELLRFCLPASQLRPWERLGLAPFTTAAARVLGLAWDGVLAPGSPADLLLLEAHSWGEVLAGPVGRRVLRQGQWLPAPPQAAGLTAS